MESAIDVAILTALKVEREAVCDAFGLHSSRDRVKRGARWYWRGQLALPGGGLYQIVVAQPAAMGNVAAAVLAAAVVRDWRPRIAILVGIAATTAPLEVKLGDVVVGTATWYYEHGKVTPRGQLPQPEVIPADAGLMHHLAGLANWDGVAAHPHPGPAACSRVHQGVIAAGEKVIADRKTRDRIAVAHRKIKAIAMEGYGFGKGMEGVQCLEVRGISDDGTPAKNDDWHTYAAAAAAAFTRHFLLDLPVSSSSTGRLEAAAATPAATTEIGARYRRSLSKRHATIKILGMSKPVALTQIYVDVTAYQRIPSRLYMSADQLDRYLRTADRSDLEGAENPRQPAIPLIEQTRRVLLLGGPGAGKTTLLKFLIGRAARSGVPIYLSLRELADSSAEDLQPYAAQDVARTCNVPINEANAFLDDLFGGGDAMFLLDGLDEVDVSHRKRVIRAIKNIGVRYPKLRIVVTCRTADYSGWLEDFDEMELAEFTGQQATTFIRRWFLRAPDKGRSLVEVLRATPHVRELCGTPLMAALVCILFENSLRLPENRVELYTECVDVLLHKWDRSRMIIRQSAYTALSTQRKKQLFSRIALDFMTQGKVTFAKDELIRHIAAFMRMLPEQGAGAAFEPDDILVEIAAHHAVVLERSIGMWSFMHLTFQEYFTALAIAQNRTEKEIVERHFHDPRWREVFLMVAALLPDASAFLTALVQAIRSLPIYEEYRPFLPFLGRITFHGLKDAKDLVDGVLSRQGHNPLKPNLIPQIKGARMVGFAMQLWNGLQIRPQTLDPPELISLFSMEMIEIARTRWGPTNPMDAFWKGAETLARYINVLGDAIGGECLVEERSKEDILGALYDDMMPGGR